MIRNPEIYFLKYIRRYIAAESIESEWIKVSDLSAYSGSSHGVIIKELAKLQKRGKVSIRREYCDEYSVVFSFRLLCTEEED
jgi:hypothetical protein